MLLAIFALVFMATVFLPGPLIVLLIANTLIGLFLSLLQIGITLFPKFRLRRRGKEYRPFVSVLVPAHNEPPLLLIETLEALSRLRYDNYEVLVIDNNTDDTAVWKPVERFSLFLGRKFRFLHVENLEGFKAGALNYALERVNPQSEYIAVVDADYIVQPNFLSMAVSYFTHRDIALVQFPQAYRNSNELNQPIADEYRHFFKIYMNMANHLDCVPSTGTVSIYRRDALRSISGFRAEAITEDADAGLRFYAAGFRGVYVDRAVGQGLMPYDIGAYRKQKGRWALGNAQSIKMLFSLFGRIPFRSWIGFLSHLTAWDHLNFLPFAVLAGYALVVTPLVPTTELHKILLNVASISIFVTILSKMILFLFTFRGEKRGVSRALKAFVVHMGMTFLYSEALMTLLFKRRLKFERTNKFIFESVPSLLKSTYKELILGSWFLLGAVEAIVFGSRYITIVVFSISAFALLSIFYVYWHIRPTLSISKELLRDAERKYRDYLFGVS